jgi:hypothetical protein
VTTLANITSIGAVPRVRQFGQTALTVGSTRFGDAIDCFGTLSVSTEGLPDVFRTNAALKCQIELGRYIGQRRKKTAALATVRTATTPKLVVEEATGDFVATRAV